MYIHDEIYSAENVAVRLKWLRKHFDLSQTEFAASIDAQKKQYNHWETGYQRLSLDGALLINQVYGISLDFLYLDRRDTLPISMIKSLAKLPVVDKS